MFVCMYMCIYLCKGYDIMMSKKWYSIFVTSPPWGCKTLLCLFVSCDIFCFYQPPQGKKKHFSALLQIKFFHKVGSMDAPSTASEKLIWSVLEAERPTIRFSSLLFHFYIYRLNVYKNLDPVMIRSNSR